MTLRDDTHQGESRITAYLQEHHPTPQTAKQIAMGTGLSYGYVRNILSLKLKGQVRRTGHAGYALVSTTLPDEIELRVQNLVIAAKSDNANPRGAWDVSLTHRRNKDFAGGVIVADHMFLHARVTFQVFRNGTVECQVGSEPGLTYVEFVRFVGWLEGMFPTLPTGLWVVRSWEWNYDFVHLRLSGAKELTLTLFDNLFLKLYQRFSGLRLEVRHRTEIPVLEAIELIAAIADRFLKRGLVKVEEIRE